jgi:hypothetical protein
VARRTTGAADKRAPERERDLTDLAEALAVRHLQGSWPQPMTADPTWFRDGVFTRYGERIRTIAVVGAGASIPMLSVADDLASELEDDLDTDKQEREVELDRLEDVYGLNRRNFETRLTALCRTPEAERKVKQKISEHYRHRHPSLLTYELLAHLLHHRFLDAIISFNFDELLDQSIEDELGPNEYTKVVTERDFDPDDSIASPLYIKMHGTASEPDSLRFTRERYYWIPKSIVGLVEQQFDVEHLVLVNIGFTMASFDFQYLLRKPKQLEIFHLDPRSLNPAVTKEIEVQRKKERIRQKSMRSDSYDRPRIVQFTAPSRSKPSGDFLEKLLSEATEALEECCDAAEAGPACWRSTLRHHAVVELLRDSDTSNPEHYTSYLRRRTILEIALTAAKGRGVLSIASMVSDRCGRYYDLYRRHAGEGSDSWQKLCRAGGLKESHDWPDTYEVLRELRENTSNLNQTQELHLLLEADPKKLAQHTIASMDIAAENVDELTELLIMTLDFLRGETEIEVHSRDDRVCSKIFTNPVTLTTLTALQGWTAEMLKSTNYNELCVVAETGQWMIEDNANKNFPDGLKEIKLLRAFDVDIEIGDDVLEARRLPWGRHNRHMTIVCRDGQPQAAIYFVRRLRAPSVTPVYLSGLEDLRRVSHAFDKLWDEADRYEQEVEGDLVASTA